MPENQSLEKRHFLFVRNFRKTYHLLITSPRKITFFIKNISDSARHSGGEILSGFAEYDDAPAGHIFAPVVAHSFNPGVSAAVTHLKALARNARKKSFAACRPVKNRVSNDDIFVRGEY